MPITSGQGNPDWTREETLLALDVLLRHWPRIPGKASAEVRNLSATIRRLPIHARAVTNERFRNPAGVYLKLQNLASLHPGKAGRKGLRTSVTDRETWNRYWQRPDDVRRIAGEIVAGIDWLATLPTQPVDEAFEVEEGAVLFRVHSVRERAQGLRPLVLQRVRAARGGLECEGCGFRARDGMPETLVLAVFEVHHLTPLAEVATVTTTRPTDLTLLCANCHRLIHAMMRIDVDRVCLEDLRRALGVR
jgi:5-methylcytosine-specific restriction protein A